MRIIVTGGAGFIGSHVVDAYLQAGHHIAVIDDLSTGLRAHVHQKTRLYTTDIRNAKLVSRIFEREHPEVVNHHAALASVVASMREPTATLETNTVGTMNLLRALGVHGRGIKRFIFASTGGALYGNPKTLPADEHTAPHPLSPYALSKLFAEGVVRYYAESLKLPFVILRYANVYGPRQNPHGEAGVFAIFSNLMQQGKQPTIFGDGSKTRDYVYVGDVAHANVLALQKATNEAVNIGTGKAVSDQMVFDTIATSLGFKKSPRYAPFRPGEVMHIRLDVKKAHRMLNWQPKVSLRDGVAKTTQSFAK